MLQVLSSAGLGRDGPPTCLQGLQPGRMGLGEALQQRTWASPWVLSHPGRGGQSREKPSLEALDLSSSLTFADARCRFRTSDILLVRQALYR